MSLYSNNHAKENVLLHFVIYAERSKVTRFKGMVPLKIKTYLPSGYPRCVCFFIVTGLEKFDRAVSFLKFTNSFYSQNVNRWTGVWWASDVMLHFFKSVPMIFCSYDFLQICFLVLTSRSWMAWRMVNIEQIFIFGWNERYTVISQY